MTETDFNFFWMKRAKKWLKVLKFREDYENWIEQQLFIKLANELKIYTMVPKNYVQNDFCFLSIADGP